MEEKKISHKLVDKIKTKQGILDAAESKNLIDFLSFHKDRIISINHWYHESDFDNRLATPAGFEFRALNAVPVEPPVENKIVEQVDPYAYLEERRAKKLLEQQNKIEDVEPLPVIEKGLAYSGYHIPTKKTMYILGISFDKNEVSTGPPVNTVFKLSDFKDIQPVGVLSETDLLFRSDISGNEWDN